MKDQLADHGIVSDEDGGHVPVSGFSPPGQSYGLRQFDFFSSVRLTETRLAGQGGGFRRELNDTCVGSVVRCMTGKAPVYAGWKHFCFTS